MKEIVYHGYTITAIVSNGGTGWLPHARISWGQQEFTLDVPEYFTSQLEAENHALALGKHWVNNHRQAKE